MKLHRTYQSFPCPYEDCGADKNNVIWWSWNAGRQLCKECGRTFGLKKGTVMENLREGRETFLETAAFFATGGTKAWKIAEFLHSSPSRVFYAINKLGNICEKLTAEICRGKVNASVLQFDEIKTFCKNKKNETWAWTCVEAVSKFWAGLQAGSHDGKVGKELMREVKRSLGGLPLAITSDALGCYLNLIRSWFRKVPYAQVQKIYKGKKLVEIKTQAFKPAGFMEIEKIMASCGLGSSINTSFVERHNKTIRRENACLQRKTDSTNKKVEALSARLQLYRFYYNFIRRQKGLNGLTPAQAAGVSKKRWTWQDLFWARPAITNRR